MLVTNYNYEVYSGLLFEVVIYIICPFVTLNVIFYIAFKIKRLAFVD